MREWEASIGSFGHHDCVGGGLRLRPILALPYRGMQAWSCQMGGIQPAALGESFWQLASHIEYNVEYLQGRRKRSMGCLSPARARTV